MTLRRTAIWCGAGFAALLGIAALTVVLAVHRPGLLRPLVQWALAPSGGSASLAGLNLSLNPPTLAISGLAISGSPRDGELLRIDHLQAELIPSRSLRGGPWLRHVEARGIVFERLRPRESESPPDLTPLTRLFDMEDLSLTDARLRMALPGGELAADDLRVSLIPGEGGIRNFTGSGELTFRRNGSAVAQGKLSAQGKVTPDPAIEVRLDIAPGRLALPWIAGDVSGHTSLRVTRKSLQADDFRMILPQARLDLGPRAQPNLGPILMEASGSATLNVREPLLEVRKLDLGGLLQARGRFRGPTLEEVTGTVDGEVPRVERVKTILAPFLPATLGSVELTGNLPFRLILASGKKDPVLSIELFLRELQLSLPDSELRCRFGGTLKAESPMQGWLHGRAGLTGKLAFREGSPRGDRNGKPWSYNGTMNIAARLEPSEPGPQATATIGLEQIEFASPTGDSMGRKLAGKIDLDALLTPQPRIKADLVLRGGEVLWGTVYVDLAKDPLDLHAEGTRAAPDDYKDLSLEGGLAGFGRLRIEGSARHAEEKWRHQGHLVFSDARLGPIFRTFLRDPLAAKHRDLAALEMEGSADVDLSFSGSGKAAELAGRLRLHSGNVLRGTEPPLLSGLDIDLPISYSLGSANPGHPRPPIPAKWGRLSLKKLRLAGQELGPLEIPAVLVPNHLYLGGEIDASLFGAKVSLRRIQVDEPLSPGFRIAMAAQLDGLDLARVAGDNSILEGHLGGRLDPVAVGMDRMTATGELAGDLYGGRLDIRRVSVEQPFLAGREIGADVTVTLLDLERLSEALGVGRITGRLSGSMEGLRVAYGQPVAFHMKMESVATKGVDQSVSLKAVNSISLVGTGSSLSGLGASLMTTFFKEFSYAKIGFECNLKNDVFTVRGLIHEDGVEYLVKKRLLTGINVINSNPDNRIGFSDMLDRAKRVTAK